MSSPPDAELASIRLAEHLDQVVRFRCLACGNCGQRPARYLVEKHGCRTLADVAARARCLAYVDRVRCRGRADVGFWVVGGHGTGENAFISTLSERIADAAERPPRRRTLS